jgi:hypothetical protein
MARASALCSAIESRRAPRRMALGTTRAASPTAPPTSSSESRLTQRDTLPSISCASKLTRPITITSATA